MVVAAAVAAEGMGTYPGRWEDIVGRNRRGSLGSGVEVGRRGFVDRSRGSKD